MQRESRPNNRGRLPLLQNQRNEKEEDEGSSRCQQGTKKSRGFNRAEKKLSGNLERPKTTKAISLRHQREGQEAS